MSISPLPWSVLFIVLTNRISVVPYRRRPLSSAWLANRRWLRPSGTPVRFNLLNQSYRCVYSNTGTVIGMTIAEFRASGRDGLKTDRMWNVGRFHQNIPCYGTWTHRTYTRKITTKLNDRWHFANIHFWARFFRIAKRNSCTVGGVVLVYFGILTYILRYDQGV